MCSSDLYSCLLVYYTPGGYRRQAWFKTIAPDPSAAATIAERLLRKDKRRAGPQPLLHRPQETRPHQPHARGPLDQGFHD